MWSHFLSQLFFHFDRDLEQTCALHGWVSLQELCSVCVTAVHWYGDPIASVMVECRGSASTPPPNTTHTYFHCEDKTWEHHHNEIIFYAAFHAWAEFNNVFLMKVLFTAHPAPRHEVRCLQTLLSSTAKAFSSRTAISEQWYLRVQKKAFNTPALYPKSKLSPVWHVGAAEEEQK